MIPLDPRLIRPLAGALAALALAGGCAWAGYAWRHRAAVAEIAECRRLAAEERQAMADAAREAEAEARRRETEIHTKQAEAVNAAQAETDAARADADRVRVALDRLRQRAAAATAAGGGRPAASAATAGASAPAAAAGDLQADVLGRVGEAAGQLAAYADRAATAGRACERAYQALSPGGL